MTGIKEITEQRRCGRCGRQTDQQLQQTHVTAETTIPVWVCLSCHYRVAGPSAEGYRALRSHGARVIQLPLFQKVLDVYL